jgi:hypothetical protein
LLVWRLNSARASGFGITDGVKKNGSSLSAPSRE